MKDLRLGSDQPDAVQWRGPYLMLKAKMKALARHGSQSVVHEVAIVGAGPAGLAMAIEAAKQGVGCVVFDARSGPLDKACGEGLMPKGVRHLQALGVGALPDDACRPLAGIHFLQEDGSEARARFQGGLGLGVRRTALVEAMLCRARDVGVDIRLGCAVGGFSRTADGMEIQTDAGMERTRLLIAADGLASPLRRLAGLDGRPFRTRRFGLRRHYRVAPWTDHVEVHWSEGAEAYVTPVGPTRVGVALLWDASALGPMRYDTLLSRFPVLAWRLSHAMPDSMVRGAGPMGRRVKHLVGDRLALLGDAAGYVDGISGEGISLAFSAAQTLGSMLPAVLGSGASVSSLRPYEQAARRGCRRHAALTHSLLFLSRHPTLRRRLLSRLARHPAIFEGLVALAGR